MTNSRRGRGRGVLSSRDRSVSSDAAELSRRNEEGQKEREEGGEREEN